MDSPSENVIKKKKPRRHRKKTVQPCVHAPHSAANGVAPSIAETALKTSLKKRLQARRKMLQVARKGGTSQEVQSILQKFNDGDDEKMNLMKDIQDDVKGMKQKDAKQYMKRVLSGMNKDQTETFVDMVKDKMPSQQSSEIVNYVKRNRSVKEKEDTKKPQVNPESVYTPAKNLSAEEKATERAKRSQRPDVPPTSTSTSTLPVKKKKGFGKININVPKLAELRNHPVLDEDEKHEETKKKSVEIKKQPSRQATTSLDRKKEIESICPPSKENDTADRNEHEVRRIQMGNRVKCLKMFSPEKLEEKLKCAVLESAPEVQFVRVKDITFLPVPEVLDVPGSEETVTDVSVESEFLCLGDWTFRKNDKGMVVKTLNAHRGCVEFVKKVEPVKQWLLTLIERRVPWKWLCDELYDLGVLSLLKQKVDENIQTKQNVFKLLCHEFPNSSDKMSVPIIPFMTIVIA